MKHFSTKRMASLLLLSLVAVSAVFAAPRTVEQAKQIAQQQMNKNAAKKVKGQGSVAAVNPQLVFSKKKIAKADDAYYYVFSAGKNLGYTIVSGDDRFPAIVGYTEQGDYDANNLPTNLVSFMQAYQDFVDNATEAQIAEINAWKAQAVHASVAPLMQEKWNQRAPYNNLCPEYATGKKAVTGCVATAVAQILHYHKCPDVLKANIPAYTTEEYGINMSGIIKGETYDWVNMLNVYNDNATDVQNEAVAKLMLHVGCAVKMDYADSSGANATPETFTKYFGMDTELVRSLARSDYQISEWDKILYEEIAAKRPVYYSGATVTNEGHAFVIHGYKDGLYYVNWGWGGMSDGYFDITILNPDNTTGAGASSSDDGYSRGNSMIIGIEPDNGVVDEVIDAVITSRSNLSGTLSVNGNILSGTVTVSPKNQNLQGKINIGLGYLDDNGNIIDVSTSYFEMDSENCPMNSYYPGISLRCSFQYEDNKIYKLILIESRDNENWIACAGAENTALTIKVENGEVKNVTPVSKLSAVATLDENNSGGYAGMSNTINVTVTNTGDKEYYDIVYVLVSNSDTEPDGYTFAQGITAPVDGSTTFNFAYTPRTAGTYNFWILDVNWNKIDKSSIEFNAKPDEPGESVAPKLSFVSITCDDISNDEENAKYGSRDYVKMNKVYDAKANFTFKIKNEGGNYEGQFIVYNKYIPAENGWKGYYQNLSFPAGETVTYTFTAEGNVGETMGVWLTTPSGSEVKIEDLSIPNEHIICDEKGQSTGSVYELKNREICYLAGPREEIIIEGEFTEDIIKELKRNDNVTTLDLTKATGDIPSKIEITNPNALIYIKEGINVNEGKNVVVIGTNGNLCSNFELEDGKPFKAKAEYPFNATQATYSRDISNVTTGKAWCSVCLPYEVTTPKVKVEKFISVNTDEETITFEEVLTMKANKPYIFEADGNVTFTAENVDVVATTSIDMIDEGNGTGGCFIGTYIGVSDPYLANYYVLKSDGTGFAIATVNAYANPFRAYIDAQGITSTSMKVIHGGGDGTTGITEVSTDVDNVGDYYNLNGVKVTTPQKGIYIKNGKKYIFK